MDNQIIFQNSNSKISIQSLYYVGGYITYEVSISTCGFLGTSNFCIEENQLKQYIKIMDSMVKKLSGELEIIDCESDAYLKIFFEDTRNFYVLGQIGGSYEDNTLKFKLKADQTLLLGLKKVLLGYCS